MLGPVKADQLLVLAIFKERLSITSNWYCVRNDTTEIRYKINAIRFILIQVMNLT